MRPAGPSSSSWCLTCLLLLAFVLGSNGFARIAEQDAVLAGGVDALPTMQDGGYFGKSIAVLNREMVAVGQEESNPGGIRRGAVWLVRLSQNMIAESYTVIDATSGLGLTDHAYFGASLAVLQPGSQTEDVVLAVGSCEAHCSHSGEYGSFTSSIHGYGSVYILTLNQTGALVAPASRITKGMGGLTAGLHLGDAFGRAMAAADIDGDGRREIVVSANTCPTGSIRGSTGICRSTVSVACMRAGWKGGEVGECALVLCLCPRLFITHWFAPDCDAPLG
jgi:hypothetical protein